MHSASASALVPVRREAVITRVRRALPGHVVATAAPTARANGELYSVDRQTGEVCWHTTLEQLARDLNVLQPWEEIR